MTAALTGLVAIGHYLGIFPTDGGQWCHEVRRGPDIEQLTEVEAGAWAAPGDPTHSPSAVDGLLRRGLLVRVSWSDATGFARAHRLLPLLPGIGPDPEDPDRWLIGAFRQPIVAVDRLGYALWAEASGHPSLWAACCHCVTTRPAVDAAVFDDPSTVLVALLDRLDTLTSVGAACLDLALPTEPGSG